MAQHNNEFNKPKTFRDRKTHAKNSGDYGDKPKHQPYKRKDYEYDAHEYMEQVVAEAVEQFKEECGDD